MTRKPKIPERGSLLNNSMDGMDELFNFQTKEESAAEKQTEKVSGENTLVEMEFAYMSAFPDHKGQALYYPSQQRTENRAAQRQSFYGY